MLDGTVSLECIPLLTVLLHLPGLYPGVDNVLGVPDAGHAGHAVHPITVCIASPTHQQ